MYLLNTNYLGGAGVDPGFFCDGTAKKMEKMMSAAVGHNEN